MALRINTDLAGSFTLNQLRDSSKALTSSLEKLSSGRRINKAADDAAGLTIANSLKSQARGLGQAMRNASDAISIAQVADGALGQSGALVNTIRTKALQAAQDSQTHESRLALQADINTALSALDAIAQNTSFNDQKLLSGNFTNKAFQVGTAPGQTIDISIGSATATTLGTAEAGTLADINVLTREGAQAAITIADAALTQINTTRAEIGAVQNQLASSINNLSATEVNIRAAESTLADVDMAEEVMAFARFKTLRQAQTFALAQARNINQNTVLGLLQG